MQPDWSVHTQAAHHELVDRKSTRLNSSHVSISYAVFCLKKKIRDAAPNRFGILDATVRAMTDLPSTRYFLPGRSSLFGTYFPSNPLSTAHFSPCVISSRV